MNALLRILILAAISTPVGTFLHAADSSAPASRAKEATPAEKSPSQVQPSKAFRDFVSKLRIVGVMKANPRRAWIDRGGNLGRETFQVGDVLEVSQGIRVYSIETEIPLVTFQDKTGALLSLKP